MSIITLYKQGVSQRQIAKLVGHDRKTVRRVIKRWEQDGTTFPIKNVKSCILDNHRQTIVDFIEKGLSGIRVHEELQRLGIKTSYTSVSRYVSNLTKKEEFCIRFHTSPGEEAQVDFGYIGFLPYQGKKKKAWVFNMRLSYSRLDYYEVVHDQKVETFLKCHINAFKYFGGIPQIVKIDNLKSAILEANFYEPYYQTHYKSLSEHYGFDIVTCRVYSPQEKGKVEAGVKYVKNNFFNGRSFTSIDDANEQLRDWQDNKCNVRLHGTTKKIPADVFVSEEKSSLRSLPLDDFVIGITSTRKVAKDCHVTFGNNYYSVPYKYAGKYVEIHIKAKTVSIMFECEEIAIHCRSEGKGNFVTNKSHFNPHDLFDPNCPKYRANFHIKMGEIGPNASAIFTAILLKSPHNWYRTVQGILHLKKLYSDYVIDAACKRALSFDITGYTKIKNICKVGSYNLPLSSEEVVHAETHH